MTEVIALQGRALDVKYVRRPMDALEMKNVIIDVTLRAV
jgi:hypothetical protein